jgi:small subunit ribosomal protein S18
VASDYARKPKIKYCGFCKDKVESIDYKDVTQLKRYVSDRGKIKPRRVTGNCAQHQRQISIAVKRAREMALMAYTTKQ